MLSGLVEFCLCVCLSEAWGCGGLQGTPENFTVVWDRHNYTYRIDANATYWLSYSEERGDAFTVRLHLGACSLAMAWS